MANHDPTNATHFRLDDAAGTAGCYSPVLRIKVYRREHTGLESIAANQAA